MNACPRPGARACCAALVLLLAGCGSIVCPGDIAEAPVTNVRGGYANLAACEAVRPTATCAPITPSAACRAHCAGGWLRAACLPRLKGPGSIVGNSCYPIDAQPITYEFQCIGTGTCECI